MTQAPFFPIAIAIGAIVLLSVFFHFVPFFLWLSAKVSGVRISLMQLFLMRIRNVPPGVIVPSLIEAHKAGLGNITRDNLEAHYMTGGHVQRVVHALVSASKANIDLSFEKATAIDLAGRDVFEAVQTSVNPKVIDTPPVAAVAKNGIQLIAKARVTVRANIPAGGRRRRGYHPGKGGRGHRVEHRLGRVARTGARKSRQHIQTRAAQGPRCRNGLRDTFH